MPDHDLFPTRNGYTYRGYTITKSGKLVIVKLDGRQAQTKTTIPEACAWIDNQKDNRA